MGDKMVQKWNSNIRVMVPGGSEVVILDNFGPHWGSKMVILDNFGPYFGAFWVSFWTSFVPIYASTIKIKMLIAGQGTVAGRPQASG